MHPVTIKDKTALIPHVLHTVRFYSYFLLRTDLFSRKFRKIIRDTPFGAPPSDNTTYCCFPKAKKTAKRIILDFAGMSGQKAPDLTLNCGDDRLRFVGGRPFAAMPGGDFV